MMTQEVELDREPDPVPPRATSDDQLQVGRGKEGAGGDLQRIAGQGE
jgi:hypothetical protein